MHLIPVDKIICTRVSSVLNKDVKNYGKKYIFDGCADTCWNSDEGKPQWISMEFTEALNIVAFTIEFQGGFVGNNCVVEFIADDKTISQPFYPEDMNGKQKFTVTKPQHSKHMKLVFNDSTDFFGRIIIYSVDIFSD